MAETPTAGTYTPIARLLDAIASAPPLPELLEQILDAACRATHADGGIIGLYEANRDVMRTAATRDLVGLDTATTLTRHECLGGTILASGRMVHGRYGDLPARRLQGIDEHEVLGLPIRWRDQLLGFVAINLAPPRRLRIAQIELIELLARVAALAVDNAQRQKEAALRSRRFELIARIAASFHQHLDLDVVLQRAADTIHEFLLFPNVDIPLIDPDDAQTLVVHIRGGQYKQAIRQVDRIPLSQGIMGAAARERRTLLVNDVARDPRYVCPPNVVPAGAEMAIPLMADDRVLGVLNVESQQPFGELDRISLEVVADYLAVAISNARRFASIGAQTTPPA